MRNYELDETQAKVNICSKKCTEFLTVKSQLWFWEQKIDPEILSNVNQYIKVGIQDSDSIEWSFWDMLKEENLVSGR